MAAVTHEAVTASTSNVSTYASASFSPAVGDLLVVAVVSSGTVDAGDVTVSANGVTSFTRVDRAIFGPTIHSVYLFVADQLTTGTAAMTVTFDCTGDAATGAIVMVSAVAGMTKTGATAIKQSTKLDDGTGGTTPAFTFGASCLTGNVTIYAIGEISTAGMLTPTNWTQGAQTSYSTPTIGGSYGYRNSGFTGTTVTWPGTETAHGGVFVELDTSASAVTGTAAGSFGFTGAAAGVPTTHGAAAASFGYTATALGVDRALGVGAAAFGFTATASGTSAAPSVEGVATGAFGFTGTANGIDTALGVAAATFGFTGTASGIDRAIGQATGPFGFTATSSGTPRPLGLAVAAFGFTGTAAGTPRIHGLAAATFGYTATATGTSDTPPVTGTALATFGFTGAANGVDRALGAGVASFGFTATAAGQAQTLGVAVASFGYTATAAGLPRVVGLAVASFGFTADATGINPATLVDVYAIRFTITELGHTFALTETEATATITEATTFALEETDASFAMTEQSLTTAQQS